MFLSNASIYLALLQDIYGGFFMRASVMPIDQQKKLIMECRTSGLTDYQWCIANGIAPSTFSNWVRRLKKKGYMGFPEPVAKQDAVSLPNEIVKLEISDLSTVQDTAPMSEVNACTSCEVAPAIEIVLNGASIRFSNDVNPELYQQTLRFLSKGLTL